MKTIILGLLMSYAGSALADGCLAPWGVYVMEGGMVTAYRESNPPRGARCDSEYRYCRSGYLSGSYLYGTCTEDMSCYEPEFGILYNMETVVAYLNPVEHGRHCQSELRQCYYGHLSGSYRNRTCTERP